jgi:hypothetical protein
MRPAQSDSANSIYAIYTTCIAYSPGKENISAAYNFFTKLNALVFNQLKEDEMKSIIDGVLLG